MVSPIALWVQVLASMCDMVRLGIGCSGATVSHTCYERPLLRVIPVRVGHLCDAC
jgi:hypothetical protein